jgi:sugar phosphate isomerase/epimerase
MPGLRADGWELTACRNARGSPRDPYQAVDGFSGGLVDSTRAAGIAMMSAMAAPEPKSRDRIAVCSWSLQPRDPAHLVEMVRALEIGAVQLALNPALTEPAVWGDAPAQIEAAGLRLASGMLAFSGEDYSTLESIARTGGVRDDERWSDHLLEATRVAGLAATARIDLVTLHAGFLPEDQDAPLRRTMLDRLHLVADAYVPRGIALAFETGQESAATLIGVLAELGRDGVGVNFDPANMILYGKGDPIEALDALRGVVRQVHVKDALPAEQPGTWGTEVPVGAGAVDWPAFFEIAETIDPPVTYVIEREAGGSRLDDVAAARDLILRHVG